MGCFSSKHVNGRVCDDMFELSGPSLISLLHGNDDITLLQIYNHSNKFKVITDLTEDVQGVIMLHQRHILQMIPVEGNETKNFVFEREGIAQRVIANGGDLVFVMPLGTMPDVVRILQGCHLSVNKIRSVLENVTLPPTTGERLMFWRRPHLPVSSIFTRWRPEGELLLDDEEGCGLAVECQHP